MCHTCSWQLTFYSPAQSLHYSYGRLFFSSFFHFYFIFFFMMYIQLHDTVQYFMEFSNDFERRGWLGCGIYRYIYLYIYVYIVILYYTKSALMLSSAAPSIHHLHLHLWLFSSPHSFFWKKKIRKYSGNSYTLYIIYIIYYIRQRLKEGFFCVLRETWVEVNGRAGVCSIAVTIESILSLNGLAAE